MAERASSEWYKEKLQIEGFHRHGGTWDLFRHIREDLIKQGWERGEKTIREADRIVRERLGISPDQKHGDAYLTKESSAWRRLRIHAEGKTCPDIERDRWALDHLYDSPEDIDPASVPSPGAVSRLRWAQASPANLTRFQEMIRVAPAKPKADEPSGSGVLDEGDRNIADLLAEWNQAHQSGESPVSASGA